MNESKGPREYLAGIYEHLKTQTEIIRELNMSTVSLFEALKERDPAFAELYAKHYKAAERGPLTQQYASLSRLISQMISELKGSTLN